MDAAVMNREAAGRFVVAWHSNWCKVDIDAVVAHLAHDAAKAHAIVASTPSSSPETWL